jgi:hypothetical protein
MRRKSKKSSLTIYGEATIKSADKVKCGNGRVDIFDETTSEIIECKLIGDADTIGAAIGQLQRYRPYFFDPQLAIGVPILWPSAKPMLEILDRSNIRLIEIAKGIGV